jgi:hypothetical protein
MIPNSPQTPVLSSNLDDLLIPGVMVEVDADVADEYGAFEELALSEADAWDANGDTAEAPSRE